MSRRRLALAALAAFALLGSAWWLRVERPRREDLRAERASRLLEEASTVRRLEVRRGEGRYVMEPVGDGSWSLSASDVDRPLVADHRAVALALGALTDARLETLYEEAAEPGSLGELGLQPERLRLTWATPSGERSLVLGDPVPPDGRRIYGLIDGRVVTVPRDLAVKTAWGSAHWRLKTLLHFEPEELRRLVIERPRERPPGVSERLVLGRDEDPRGVARAWRVLEPFDAPAHPAKINSLRGQLQLLMADGFGPESPSEEELKDAGLLPPRVVLSLHFTDGTTRRLALGRPRELRPDEIEQAKGQQVFPPVLGRLDEGGIVHVRPDLAEALLREDDDYRDNRALPIRLERLLGFTFTKPRKDGPPAVLELSRELEGSWSAVRPAAVELPLAPVTGMFTALQDVRFGRFEDALAEKPDGFETAYDLSEPDGFRLEARGLDLEGRAIGLDVEAAPPGAILRDRLPFRPVLITDQAGRRTIGVAKFRAFDEFLERVFALRELIVESEAP